MRPPALPDRAALFLDFDGVLVEIAASPDAIQVPPALQDRLDRLHDRLDGALALVSGRHVADLRRYLPRFAGVIAGSHGAEMAHGDRVDLASGAALDIAAIHAAAHHLAAAHGTILVEEKPLGVAMHYRAEPALAAFVDAAMRELEAQFPGTRLQPAKMAVELQPEDAGKDGALGRLMSAAPFQGRVPVYVGDDLTDEPAMTAAQDRGGFAIKIGEGDSVARYRLADPPALARWLDRALQQ
ncbi:trehalose-phosphatase [Paracoccus aurantiacus]|uniref:Trehalose 6-phosphate phosphatase n=1 Tax=Paracoccus aurantiacus TaxID=2599412 RepID=A0A5C6S177_9RHOB|nr:trehalose-phosphatase [Paracoccus aurantiacus]TXB68154.1 trehalose-phosphatase [Paracoccus aurantiacus]